MTPKQILILRIVCLILLVICSIVKFVYWYKAKKDNNHTKMFIVYYFRWFGIYALYDNDYADVRDFMKVSNATNRIIWPALIIIIASYFLNHLSY